MTAKEMFEELGYKHNYYREAFGYVGNEYKCKEPCSGIPTTLLFSECDKELHFIDLHKSLTPKEIEAITQQMKELGWLE